MQWIESSVSLEEPINASAILSKIERAFRTCYRSENLIKEGSAESIIRGCVARGHYSPLEHASITFRVICDRGVSHEWVRHRLASYSQESTRYCNYSKDKFGRELVFIYPTWYGEPQMDAAWASLQSTCAVIEQNYMWMMDNGVKPDVARAILPNCLKTEFVCTMNIRELINFFSLRCDSHAHPDIRKLANQLLQLLRDNGLGIFFEGLKE